MRTTKNRALLFLCVVYIACMSTECGPDPIDENLVSAMISDQGGKLVHPGGFSLEFPEGAFEESVVVSVELIDLPQALPNEIELKSEVFEVNTSGEHPRICAHLSFVLSDDNLAAEEGELGIYRWDGEEWTFAGGNINEGLITTEMRNFSVFIIGTGRSLHKKFRFKSQGEYNAMVFVNNYLLSHPDLDAPITGDWGTPCFTINYEPFGGNLGWYPQGYYQFCADWIDTARGDDIYKRRHRIIGGDPPHWSYSLNQNTSLIVPPDVYVHATYAGSQIGPCAARAAQNDIFGTWNGVFLGIWGQTRISIGSVSWYFEFEGYSVEGLIAQIDYESGYVILKNEEETEFQKFAWTFISSDQIYLDVYDSQSAFEAALNDNFIEMENLIFTREGSSVGGTVPTEGLVAEFTFSGNAEDGGSHAYTASVIGAELTTDRFGKSNSAYYFSGSDYIHCPDIPQLENVTLVAWFKTNHNYSDESGFILGSASASGFFVVKGTNRLNAYLETGYNDYNQSISSASVNDNTWHMAAISYSGSQVVAYLDGSAYNSTDDTGILDYDKNGMWIGRFWHSDQDFFIGSIDDIRVYDRALSASQIKSLYNE